MSQGLVDHSDIDAFEATQSRDCEPSPPQPLHHGSKTNFFSPTGSGFLPGDAAALQHPVPPSSLGGAPANSIPLQPLRWPQSPCRTPPRSLTSPTVGSPLRRPPLPSPGAAPRRVVGGGTSPSGRRFVSESELDQANGNYPPCAPPVSTDITANRTMLGWEARQPPPRPGSRGDVRATPTPAGSSVSARRLSGGGGGTPPQGGGSKGSVLEGTHYSGRGAAPRRPMSFVKALEMTDSTEKGSSGSRPQRNADGTASASGERRSVYDMNYEISV